MNVNAKMHSGDIALLQEEGFGVEVSDTEVRQKVYLSEEMEDLICTAADAATPTRPTYVVIRIVADPPEPDPPSAAEVLARIADAYDDNDLDDEARKFYGNGQRVSSRDPDQIELYAGRGGRQLLTLGDCLRARKELNR